MELTEQLFNRISRYVNGEMDIGEQVLFEAEMNRNDELKAEVTLYREIQALSESANEKLKKEMTVAASKKKTGEEEVREIIALAREHWEREHETLPPVKRNTVWPRKEGKRKSLFPDWMLLAAAIVIGVMGIGLFWFMNSKPVNIATSNKQMDPGGITASKETKGADKTPQIKDNTVLKKPAPPSDKNKTAKLTAKELFAAYFKPDDAPDRTDKLLSEPLSFYKKKNFYEAAEALEMAKAALDVRAQNETGPHTRFYVYYYLAQTHLAAGKNPEQSIDDLKQALKEAKSKAFESKARWYLSLAYLKKGNIAEATKYAYQLTATDNAYQQQASELLNQLSGN